MNPRSPFDLIPTPARILAAVISVSMTALMCWFLGALPHTIFGVLMSFAGGLFLAAYILLSGFVYGDARRRGMPAVAWTLLAMLVPNGVGFVIYFLLRKPMVHACPSCGYGVAPEATFCPRCGHRQWEMQAQPS